MDGPPLLHRSPGGYGVDIVLIIVGRGVPPTGAKGLNLAAGDVHYLYQAFADFYDAKSTAGLDAYSDRALARVWQAERFSWWMTMLLHRFPERSGFDQKVQRAELEYLARSRTAQASLAENYVGLPY